jgi:2-dehydropantoate 2-reductase
VVSRHQRGEDDLRSRQSSERGESAASHSRNRDAVAVVGAGAVGLTLAAGLAEAGHPVLLCGRHVLDTVTVHDERGVRKYPLEPAHDPALVHRVPWVVLATKIHQTEQALSWLMRLADQDTHVVVAQNGVDHRERLAGVAGHITPALVYFSAERMRPGVVRARSPEKKYDLLLPNDRDGDAVADLFAQTPIRVEQVADFTTASWAKLLINAVTNPITALTARRLGVLHEAGVDDVARELLRETVAVGRAEGAALTDDMVEETIDAIWRLDPEIAPSTLQDRLAGRPLELDGLTGVVVRRAARHGIDVPASRMLLALLNATLNEAA